MSASKGVQLIAAISSLTDDGWTIGLSEDDGPGSMTVTFRKDGQSSHTHVGHYGGSTTALLDSLVDLFVHRRGLSLASGGVDPMAAQALSPKPTAPTAGGG